MMATQKEITELCDYVLHLEASREKGYVPLRVHLLPDDAPNDLQWLIEVYYIPLGKVIIQAGRENEAFFEYNYQSPVVKQYIKEPAPTTFAQLPYNKKNCTEVIEDEQTARAVFAEIETLYELAKKNGEPVYHPTGENEDLGPNSYLIAARYNALLFASWWVLAPQDAADDKPHLYSNEQPLQPTQTKEGADKERIRVRIQELKNMGVIHKDENDPLYQEYENLQQSLWMLEHPYDSWYPWGA